MQRLRQSSHLSAFATLLLPLLIIIINNATTINTTLTPLLFIFLQILLLLFNISLNPTLIYNAHKFTIFFNETLFIITTYKGVEYQIQFISYMAVASGYNIYNFTVET